MSDGPQRMFDSHLLGARRNRAMVLGFGGGPEFLWRRAAEGLTERLADTPRLFTRAAVLGTGAGIVSDVVAARPGLETLRLVDPSAAMLAAAMDGPGANALNAVGTQDPCEVLPLAEAASDVAVSAMLMHWMNDPVGHLVQLRRALEPDGLMLGCLLGGETLADLRAAFVEAEAELLGGAGLHVAPMADLRALGAALQRAGFAMPVADLETVRVSYPDPLALMRDLRAMGETSLLAGRSRGMLRRDVLALAMARYAERCWTTEGRVEARFDLIFLTGWAPGPDQPKPLRPGSATVRLADILGMQESKNPKNQSASVCPFPLEPDSRLDQT